MLTFLDGMPESHPLIRVKRRLGRIRRWVKRRWWERNIGRQYQAWITDSFTRTRGTVDNSPAIAIIVPVFNPPVHFLDVCLESVLDQTATNWQLIISDDGSTAPDVVAYLDSFANTHAHDARIIVLRNSNGGISAACNRGVEQVTADWFGWLDHDDQLNPRSIELVSEALHRDPSIDVIYSDEDKIDSRGRHFDLYCKPDFSPELLLTQMYLCHFTAFRTAMVRGVGGFRSEMDGAQDFDLALRLLPILGTVAHIPRPLYHWRAWEESTALTIEAKPWAQEAAARAQAEHLQRTFGGGSVTPSTTRGLNEVHPRVAPTPAVSVIIPTIGTRSSVDGSRYVDNAVRSLRQRETSPLEIIAVTTGVIAPVPGVDHQVLYAPKGEFNFADAINLGRAHASGEYLVILNDDTTVVSENPVERMLELAQIPGVGVTGALLTYPDRRIQHAGIVLLPSGPTHVHIGKGATWPGYFGSTLTPRNYSAVTAAAMMVKSDVFDQLGGFDPVFARDFNDVDFCLRARSLGYRVAWTPYAHLVHHEGASIVRRKADPHEHKAFVQRWETILRADPYYSPALNPELERIFEAL